MPSSRFSGIKRTDRRAISTECQGCGKLFGSMFSYDQHRRSYFLRGTACSAQQDQNRLIVTAAARPNMSIAVLERRPATRTRGKGQVRYILHIMDIKHILHI